MIGGHRFSKQPALNHLAAFKTEAEERTFWKTHDATDYLDLSKVQRVTFADVAGAKEAKDFFFFMRDSSSVAKAATDSATTR